MGPPAWGHESVDTPSLLNKVRNPSNNLFNLVSHGSTLMEPYSLSIDMQMHTQADGKTIVGLKNLDPGHA